MATFYVLTAEGGAGAQTATLTIKGNNSTSLDPWYCYSIMNALPSSFRGSDIVFQDNNGNGAVKSYPPNSTFQCVNSPSGKVTNITVGSGFDGSTLYQPRGSFTYLEGVGVFLMLAVICFSWFKGFSTGRHFA